MCKLQSDEGEYCTGWELFWYYDAEIKRCRMFYYGGCAGNGNRFESEQACEKVCMGAGPVEPIVPVEPTEPTEWPEEVEATHPAEPAEPTESTEPEEPEQPEEPEEPLEPLEPEEPVEPEEPAEPTEPADGTAHSRDSYLLRRD